MAARPASLASLFAIDPRGLAALRVGLGLCALADIGVRATSLRAHYTDAGVLPRSEAIELFAWLHEWGWSMHLLGGSTLAQAVLFGVHAVAAGALILGVRSNLAAAIVWALTSSVQLRNLFIGGGFDALLRLLLLWAMFLPLGARASVDRHQRTSPLERTPHASIASAAFLLQTAIVYFAAGLAKAEEPVWRNGEALQRVLQDEFFTTRFGAWLGGSDFACQLATWAVLGAELVAPPLLFALAFAPAARTALIGALLAMNLGFGLALSVGPFPWIMSVALLAFVPPATWNRIGPGTRTGRARWPELTPALAAPTRRLAAPAIPGAARRAAAVLCAALLAYTLVWNVGVARDPAYGGPPGFRWFGHTFFLQQSWRMFARPSSLTGWLVVSGRLVDGRAVDLLAAGGPVPGDDAIGAVSFARPHDIVATTADIRWRQLLRRTSAGSASEGTPLHYGRYLCATWNDEHAGGEQLAGFEIVRFFRRIEAPFAEQPYERRTVWKHDCFG